MSVVSELIRIGNAKAAIRNSILNKGVTIPENAILDEYPAFVDAIFRGGV